MPQRRRFATREELVDLLGRGLRREIYDPAVADYAVAVVKKVVDELAALGVDVDGLVRLDVDEADVATYPDTRSLAQRIAAAQPRIRLS